MKHLRPSRRQLLQMGAAVGGSLLAGRKALALETDSRSQRTAFSKVDRSL